MMIKNTLFAPLFGFFCLIAMGASTAAYALNIQETRMLKALEAHLNSLKTLQVSFVEKNRAQRASAKGDLAWEGGKFNWVYHSPSAMRLVGNGGMVYYIDTKNNQATQVPKAYTQSMSFLMQPQLTFDLPGFTVEKVAQKGKFVRVTLNMDTDMMNIPAQFKVDSAKTHLTFQTNPLKLVQLNSDMGPQSSETTFTKVLMNQPINPQVHNFTLPNQEDRFGG